MPRVPIAEENRTGEGGDRFPRVKLNDKGEKTRFTIIEIPWREYVHYLKSPTWNSDKGLWEKETKKRKNGDEYTDWKLTFVGQPICLGDEGTLGEKGLDEKNCPACKASVESGGDIPGPTQRFAVNVIEYSLRGNTWDIKKPFSAEIKLWSFTGRQYDEIEGIQEEIGDLRKHDITLECDDPYWNRNKLSFKMEPGYKEGTKEYIQELLTTPGNKANDDQLKDACGRDVKRNRLQEDVDHVVRAWRKLRNEAGDDADSYGGGPADLEGGIDDLLADEADAAVIDVAEEQTEADGQVPDDADDDPFGASTEDAPATPASAKPAASAKSSASTAARPSKAKAAAKPKEEPKQQEESGDDDFDFDNLLDGI